MNMPATELPATEPSAARVKWKVDQLKSSCVNFANANTTREKVVMNFGRNDNWNRMASEVEIELAHRDVLGPFPPSVWPSC